MKFKFLLLIIHFIFSQNTEIVDTLDIKNIGYDKKIIIKTIKTWQQFSYSDDKRNCQFSPSCSNYFALSVFNHNTYFGIIKGCDRILRCNVFAQEYHKKNTFNPQYSSDGRMVDSINPNYNPKLSKNIITPIFLSIIPGVGRMYSGRFFDGLFSFSTIMLITQAAYIQYNNGNFYLSYSMATISFTLWLSDFYGAYRSAKLAK